jgi:DNA-binding NarL/FixJ family response regulator
MRNVTALDFARLYADFVLVETLSGTELATTLREIADMVEIKPPEARLVLHEAYSLESAHETMVAVTTLLLRFRQQGPSRCDEFTEQEMEIFKAMALGLTISKTAQHMKMDEGVFRSCMGSMCEKTGMGIAELFEFAKTKADYDAGKTPGGSESEAKS